MSRSILLNGIVFMTLLIITAFLSVSLSLPMGYEKAEWGITSKQLEALVPIVKINPGDNYYYAEHMEIDPDVYVFKTKEKKRIEYYFYKGKLYKIFVVYDRVSEPEKLYQQLKDKMITEYGEAARKYQRKVFGMLVIHTQWEDDKTIFDLRNGAGFIYQVRVQKDALKMKESTYNREKSI